MARLGWARELVCPFGGDGIEDVWLAHKTKQSDLLYGFIFKHRILFPKVVHRVRKMKLIPINLVKISSIFFFFLENICTIFSRELENACTY